MKNVIFYLIIMLSPMFLSVQLLGAELQVIAGAGPSTQVVTQFVKLLEKSDVGKKYQFRVPQKSSKHKGGLDNTAKFIFGRTGRPFNDKEKKMGLEELYLARVPITFVSGTETGVKEVSIDQICGLFTGKIKNWKEVGGNDAPVIIFSREPTEALFLQLKRDLSCLKSIQKTKFVYKKDHQIVSGFEKLKKGKTAVGFGAKTFFPEKYHLKVKGFHSGVANGLVYKTGNRNHELVAEAKKLAQSKEWKNIIAAMGLQAP